MTLGQLFTQRASVTKHCNLATVKEWWCPVAGKVTVSHESYQPCVTDLVIATYILRARLPKKDVCPADAKDEYGHTFSGMRSLFPDFN